MDAVWHFIADCYQAVFNIMPTLGLWFNKLLIVVGFVAFFYWVKQMAGHKEIEQK